jgi:hypothetical protein
VGRLYFGLLIGFTLFGAITVQLGSAMALFKVLGVVAGPVLCLAALQTFRVNTSLLPRELRPSIWPRAGLICCAIFYACMAAAVLLR